ncbi:MAG: hypothetical protein ACOCW3_01115 [Spirochaetota bacterium]
MYHTETGARKGPGPRGGGEDGLGEGHRADGEQDDADRSDPGARRDVDTERNGGSTAEKRGMHHREAQRDEIHPHDEEPCQGKGENTGAEIVDGSEAAQQYGA